MLQDTVHERERERERERDRGGGGVFSSLMVLLNNISSTTHFPNQSNLKVQTNNTKTN